MSPKLQHTVTIDINDDGGFKVTCSSKGGVAAATSALARAVRTTKAPLGNHKAKPKKPAQHAAPGQGTSRSARKRRNRRAAAAATSSAPDTTPGPDTTTGPDTTPGLDTIPAPDTVPAGMTTTTAKEIIIDFE